MSFELQANFSQFDETNTSKEEISMQASVPTPVSALRASRSSQGQSSPRRVTQPPPPPLLGTAGHQSQLRLLYRMLEGRQRYSMDVYGHTEGT